MQANTLRRAADVFRNILPGLALFEVCYKMAVGFLLRPVFSWLADHALSRNAELAFNERIVGALVTPAGVTSAPTMRSLKASSAFRLRAWSASQENTGLSRKPTAIL